MARAFITLECDTGELRRFLRSLQDDLRAAQQLSFDLLNTARDESARNPAHQIFYYEAVNSGRVEIVAMQNRTNLFPQLHYKVSQRTVGGVDFAGEGGEWVVTKRVGPSSPLHITDQSLHELRESLPRKVEEALAGVRGFIDRPALLRVLRAMETEVKRVFREVTLESTELYDTDRNLYGVESSPLADSFVTREGAENG